MGYDTSIPYAFGQGYTIGTDMRERGAREKIASGLTAYQQALEGGTGAVPIEGGPSSLQEAENLFYAGLREGNMPLSEVKESMVAFSRLKANATLKDIGTGVTTWGTDAGAEAFENAFAKMMPGVEVSVVGFDEESDSLIAEIENPDGTTEHRPFSRKQVEQMAVNLDQGPIAALAYDPQAREINERFAGEKQAAELAKTTSQTALNLASAEDELTQASQRTAAPPKGQAAAVQYVSSGDLVSKLDMEYADTLYPLYEANPSQFAKAYISMATDLSTELQRPATPDEVLHTIAEARGQ